MEDSQDSDVVSDDHERAKEFHTFKQDMAEMKQSTRFIMKRLNEIKFNKGHSDLDYDNICPEYGCSFGSQKDHEDLLSRIRQLEVTDKKRENEVKLLLKAVQNLVERFDIFLTNMESHLDLSTDGKIDRAEQIQSHYQSLNLTNLHPELKTGENVGNENNQNKLDNMATHHSEVVRKSNFSKGEISEKDMDRKTETSKRSTCIENSMVAQSDNSHRTDSKTANQIQHESDESQKTSQEIRSQVVLSDVSFMNQPSNFPKPKTDTQMSKPQPSSSTVASSSNVGIPDHSPKAKYGQKTLVTQSAGSDPNSSSTAVGISKPNFTQIKQKQQATPGTKTERDSPSIKTVLCIDISASMRTDNAWEQTTQFFTEFMNETEREVTIEMFAITTFGIQTQIVQTMTMDLSRLHQTFELLTLGGPSPLYGGLNKALFAAGPVTSVLLDGMVVFPRIILISDGHATDPTLIQGPDVVEGDKMKMIMDSTCQVAMELAKRKVRVSCVPVGNANMTLLEKISSITNGKIYSFEDGALLAKFAKHNRQASKLIQHRNLLSEIKHQEVTLEEAMRDPSFVSSPLQKEKKVILDLAKYALEQHLYEDEREDPLFRMGMKADKEEPDGLYYEEIVNSENTLPKPGSRVCRGPDWNRENEDVNGVGTVVGHPRDYWVNVVWDYSKTIYKYSYGAQGNFEVVITDDPRVLDFDELIAVGCHVHRGKNWFYGNDDGGPGSKGVVLKVQEDGKVLVRWENKRKIYYDFGKEGNNAVEICSPFDVSLSFQQSPMWSQTQYLPPAFKPQNKRRVNKNKSKNKNSSQS